MSRKKKHKKLLLTLVETVFEVAQGLKDVELEMIFIESASKVARRNLTPYTEILDIFRAEFEKRGMDPLTEASFIDFALELTARVLKG